MLESLVCVHGKIIILQIFIQYFFLLFVDKLQAEERERQKAIDDWLPITSSRNAKWYYSAFHNVTAIVGAGVLSLPYAMPELGWYVLLNFISYKVVLLFCRNFLTV